MQLCQWLLKLTHEQAENNPLTNDLAVLIHDGQVAS